MKAIKVGSSGKVSVLLIVLLAIIVLCVVGVVIFAPLAKTGKVLNYNLSEPLNGATTAKIDINPGDGNLMIGSITGSEPELANGTLQYLEKKGLPGRSLNTSNGITTLTLKANDAAATGFRFPWEGCYGATEWQIFLNPGVQSDLTAYSNGGNVNLNLAGMSITHVSAETGGGNVDVVLPDNAGDLEVTAKTGGGNVTVSMGSGTNGSNTINATSGAGNVVVNVPADIAARIHVTSGMGNVTMDPSFIMMDKNTYESPDFDSAVDKVEITANSGAGNVSVNIK